MTDLVSFFRENGEKHLLDPSISFPIDMPERLYFLENPPMHLFLKRDRKELFFTTLTTSFVFPLDEVTIAPTEKQIAWALSFQEIAHFLASHPDQKSAFHLFLFQWFEAISQKIAPPHYEGPSKTLFLHAQPLELEEGSY